MQLVQIMAGVEASSEVIMMAYVYKICPKSDYEHATSVIQAAPLLGNVFAGFLGQGLVLAGFPLINLFYISLCAVSIGAVLFIFLPAGISTNDNDSTVRTFFDSNIMSESVTPSIQFSNILTDNHGKHLSIDNTFVIDDQVDSNLDSNTTPNESDTAGMILLLGK